MTFIVPAPTPTVAEQEISNGVFWPAIAPAEIREAQRIDGTVTPMRLRGALVEAIARTNGELNAWRIARQGDGHTTLAAVPADAIDGTSILVHRYQRAVGCCAKALLLERLRDFDSTGRAEKKADLEKDPIDDHWRDYRHAISDITGIGRCTVELI